MSLLRNRIGVAALVVAMAGGTVGLLSTPTHQKTTTQYQTLYSKPTTTTNKVTPNAYGIYLTEGSRGEMVTYLQYGLYINNNNPGSIDGVFGRNTTNAVKRFQASNGLPADGIVGNQTWNKMTSIIRGIQQRLRNVGLGVTVDGIPGPSTVIFIKKFQEMRRLPQTGIVSGETYNKLMEVPL